MYSRKVDGLGIAQEVQALGYACRRFVLRELQCELLRTYLTDRQQQQSLFWEKDLAVTDRLIRGLALDPPILDVIVELLGPNVILWGASVIVRVPGQVHYWHTDIESACPEGGFVSVWIGIENTRKDTGLKFVPGSHLFGRSLQEGAYLAGVRREDRTDANILALARSHDRNACIVQPQVSNGDAVFFDGRMWHGSHHLALSDTRTALLLQYAAAHKPVHCPDYRHVEWPFRLTGKRPPCLLVAGEAKGDANWLVPPNLAPNLTRWRVDGLNSTAHQFDLSLQPTVREPWRPVPAVNGSTPVHEQITCHASVLAPGHSPHPPHSHIEEELLVVISGSAEIVVPKAEGDANPHRQQLGPGDFVYYPAYQWHTIRNVSSLPVNYAMLKWRGRLGQGAARLGVQVSSIGKQKAATRDFSTQLLFEGPTDFLDKLHAHSTRLLPGGGYEPHSDPYDVAIIVLQGRIEVLGRALTPGGMAFCVAGEEHGMRNSGNEEARYLVFEFHRSERQADLDASGRTMPPVVRLQVLAKRVQRRLRRELSRLKKAVVSLGQ